MKKDVIYIDTEDDITSIIEKVKSSAEKIVALVPPKRVGVLQSAVNLKLLQKAASTADKHLVLISTDKSLYGLAAGVKIPIARNLQSRPEIVNVNQPPVQEEDDVINGAEIPIGEFAESSPAPAVGDDDETIELPDDLDSKSALGSSAVGDQVEKSKIKKPSVPNFSKFRKKLIFIVIGALLLIGILVWLIVFAPHATVNISAKTSQAPVDFSATLDPAGQTDPEKTIIKPDSQQIKKTNQLDFDATGTKQVGKKASGVVTLTNCASRDPISVPAGTAVSSNGLNFITASQATIAGGSSSSDFGGCDTPGTTNVSVSGQKIGEEYNLPSGRSFTIAGQPAGVGGSNQSDFSGGSKRNITVVSADDVAAAKKKVAAQDQAAIKKQLSDNFDEKKQFIIDESFAVTPGDPSVSPAVGAEASQAHITQEITYSLQALYKSDVSKVVKAYVTKHSLSSEATQQVYEDGLKDLKLSKFVATADQSSIQLATTAQIGPKIDVKQLKPQLVDKNYEDIRQLVKQIDGVKDVDTNFTPFWVNKISDPKKITIKFNLTKK